MIKGITRRPGPEDGQGNGDDVHSIYVQTLIERNNKECSRKRNISMMYMAGSCIHQAHSAVKIPCNTLNRKVPRNQKWYEERKTETRRCIGRDAHPLDPPEDAEPV